MFIQLLFILAELLHRMVLLAYTYPNILIGGVLLMFETEALLTAASLNPPPPPQPGKWTTEGQGLLLLQMDKGRTETYRPQGTDGDN